MKSIHDRWEGAPRMNSKERARKSKVRGAGVNNDWHPIIKIMASPGFGNTCPQMFNSRQSSVWSSTARTSSIAKPKSTMIHPSFVNHNSRITPRGIMAGALVLGGSTAELPPIALIILGGGALTAGILALYERGFGDPKKWSYGHRISSQEPWYNPPQGQDPDNPKFNFNFNGWKKWVAAGLVGGVKLHELYESFKYPEPASVKKDTTKVLPQFKPYHGPR